MKPSDADTSAQTEKSEKLKTKQRVEKVSVSIAMDQQAARLVEQYQESKLQKAENNNNRIDEDENYNSASEDDLLDLLEDDKDENGLLAKYRDARLAQLSSEIRKINDVVDDTNDEELGRVVNMDDERSVMDFVTNTPTALVHFYMANFEKCKIMNERLSQLAEKHLAVKIVSIKAENAPFLVHKLNIKVLPFVAIYNNGKEIDRLVGFEKLGNSPTTLSYEALEHYLLNKNIINRRTINIGTIRSKKLPVYDSDEELDI